jgi:hypothetical protein
MYPGIQPDFFEKWLPRRATLLVVIGIWVAAFAVAGATVWRMDHPTARTDETKVIDMGSESLLFTRVDTIVGHRAPRIGVALRQKP